MFSAKAFHQHLCALVEHDARSREHQIQAVAAEFPENTGFMTNIIALGHITVVDAYNRAIRTYNATHGTALPQIRPALKERYLEHAQLTTQSL